MRLLHGPHRRRSRGIVRAIRCYGDHRIPLPRPRRTNRRHGARLVASLPAAKTLFDRANEILGYDLAKICFEGPAEKLDSTVHSQPALFVTSLAALESLKQKSPDVVEACRYAAGLSLGEYTALVFAGALDFEDGLRVVAERGAAMQAASDATPSGMVSILGLDRDKIEQLCRRVRRKAKCCKSPTCSAPATSSSPAPKTPASALRKRPPPPAR